MLTRWKGSEDIGNVAAGVFAVSSCLQRLKISS